MTIATPTLVQGEAQWVLYRLKIQNGTPIATARIETVLGLKEGEKISKQEIEKAVSYLRKWGRFEKIEVQEKVTSRGLHLDIALSDSLLITNIRIQGQFPYLTSRIKQVLGIRVGQIYHRDKVIEEVKKVRSFFEREGYFDTQVRVKEDINEKSGKARLIFVIRKGSLLRWRDIHVEGATVFPPGFFSSKINSWLPYQPKRLRRSIERIKEAYKNKGYPRAQIKIASLNRDFSSNKIDLNLRVSEREYLTLDFKGNKRISDRTLKKITTFFREEGVDEFEVEESRKAIERLYHSKGYTKVEVFADSTRQARRKVKIVFTVEEGSGTQIKEINIVGNEKIKGRKIKKVMISKKNGLFQSGAYSPNNVEKDKKIMTRFYRRSGFPKMEVESTSVTFNKWKDQVVLNFDIYEGQQLLIKDVKFLGGGGFSKRKLYRISKLKKGKLLNRDKVDLAVEKIKIAYASHGYPYVQVDPNFHVDEDSGVEVEFHIDQGALVHVGELLIIGNDKTKSQSIKRAMALKTGDLFSYEKVLKSTAGLRKLGAFRSVNIETIGLAEHDPLVHILIHVEEEAPYIIDFKGTYDTDNKLSTSLTFTNLNFLGYAKRTNFKLTAGADLLRVESNYIDARFFGQDLEFILTAFAQQEQRPSFDASDLGGSFAFLHEFNERLNLLFKYEVVRTVFLRGTPDPDDDTQNRTLPKVSVSASYDTRDYFADPKYGQLLVGSIDTFHRLLGIGENFLHLSTQFLGYRTVKFITFANSVRLDSLFELTDDVIIPRRKLLFLGGDYSVRGFEEDKAGDLDSDVPVGGQVRLIYNFENQIKITKNFKFATFLDTGTLTEGFTNISLDSIRHSAGLGLRYITPVGPLRLDYGFKLDKKSDEPIGRLHFTFGFAF